MPCDAVATVSAQVAQKFIQELLASEDGQKALIHWLKTEGWGEAENISQNAVYAHGTGKVPGLTLRLRERGLIINIQGQEVMVQGARGDKTPGTLKEKLSIFVRDLGGALLQQKIATAIKQRYNVIESTTAPNKAVILSVRL